MTNTIFETVVWLLGFAGIFALGAGLGFYLARSKKPKYPYAGTLFINYNDPTKELMTFRFDYGLDELEEMDYILFEVKTDKEENSNPKNSQGENS